MIGMNFLANYTCTADKQWQPYLFGGGGPVYSFADVPFERDDLLIAEYPPATNSWLFVKL